MNSERALVPRISPGQWLRHFSDLESPGGLRPPRSFLRRPLLRSTFFCAPRALCPPSVSRSNLNGLFPLSLRFFFLPRSAPDCVRRRRQISRALTQNAPPSTSPRFVCCLPLPFCCVVFFSVPLYKPVFEAEILGNTVIQHCRRSCGQK